MLNKILTLSLKHRIWVIALILLLSGYGIYLTQHMNVDIFPDLSAPTVTIMTEAHGLDAVEVEKLVTYPIEAAMNGTSNVRRIRSSSAAGVSIVWVEFSWGTDILNARQLINERIPTVKERLPEGVSMPTMTPISSIMGEIMLISLQSDAISPMKLRSFADWTISPQLKSIGGIANIIVLGGKYKQYQVLADPDKLNFHSLGIETLYEKVKETNVNTSGGIINQYGNQYLIKGYGKAHTLKDLEDGVIKISKDGFPVKISDVAKVQIGAADKIGDGSYNTKDAVILIISKQPKINTIALTNAIDKKIENIIETSPKHIHINNQIFRQADFIEASINNLKQTLLEGAFFVVVVLILFLMNWRTTFISLLAIPVSLFVSIIVLKLFGYTINTMSLGGMAIAVGALVDDAIIDVENVFKHLRENIKRPKEDRLPTLTVVKNGSIEIRSSIIIATLIIIVSFIPLFFLSGMEGRLLKPLGIAFITSILTSLFIAVTLTPVLCSYLLSNDKTLLRQANGTAIEKWLKNWYSMQINRILKIPKIIIISTFILFIFTTAVFSFLGRSFLPEFNEGSLVISIVGSPEMSIEESNKVGLLAESLLLEMEEIKDVTRRTGRAEMDEHAQGVNASELDVPFTLEDKSKEQFFEEVRKKLRTVPGVNITIGQPIAHRIDHMLSGTRSNIAIKIFGPELQDLFTLGKKVENTIKNIEGIADVALDQQIEVPQISIVPKRALLAAHGLSIDHLMHQIEIGFGGEKAGEIYEGEKYFDIVVRFQKEKRQNIEKIKNTLISLPDGHHIPLNMLADVKSVSTPNTVSRENVQRKIVVAANVQGRDLKGAVEAIQQRVKETVDFPDGYTIQYGGQFESETKASRLLFITAILAILVIFLLLYFEFSDWKLSFIVLLNLPLALIGGVFIVYFTSGIVSIASTIGFISLFGIATRNGILLISKFEDLKDAGVELLSRIKIGAIDRLNPILMTTFTTGLALIPLALKGDEPGNEIQNPMAIVILGGLLSATVLNLIVVPCIYYLFNRTERKA